MYDTLPPIYTTFTYRNKSKYPLKYSLSHVHTIMGSQYNILVFNMVQTMTYWSAQKRSGFVEPAHSG